MSKLEVNWLDKVFSECYRHLLDTQLKHWLNTLPQQMTTWQHEHKHGDLYKWIRLLNKLPSIDASHTDLLNSVSVASSDEPNQYQVSQIEGLLKQFMPWRKGPFHIHGVDINTEWRSDWKWDRVIPHIADLKDKQVLDVGCGSGYHMWRMLGQGARSVIGIDPTQLFFIQFHAIKHFIPRDNIHLLPLGIEQMQAVEAFDTVFSMGVLYHRKDPMLFLNQLKDQLKPGGELVLETLVVDGDTNTVMMAGERYAQMRNVWFLPSVEALIGWLERLGFTDCRAVDVNVTSLDEQRATEWMTSHSLADFLDPEDRSKTVEGAPAPKRAVIVANKKG